MQKLLIYFSLAAVLGLGACSIHQPDVQQGNVLDPEALAQLKPGLDKRQVRFILGDPMITDSFHPQRWDYVYWLKPKSEPATLQRLTIHFENDVVTRMDAKGVELPAAAQPGAAN